ncbi:response regulator [bacterium]|nr:response regulator [bacterium]
MSSQSVLVLDDEALIALDLSDAVREAGGRVIGPVMSIEDAVSVTESETPDIAFLDVNVRNQTSWELARILLQKECRVVFFSADDKPATFETDFEGCIYVRKPAMRQQILDALDEVAV